MRCYATWNQRGTPDESLTLIRNLALSHSERGGVQGGSISALIRSGDILSVCDYDLDYRRGSVQELRHCRQAIAFFSKYSPYGSNDAKEARAKAKFVEAEEDCFVTNELFKARASGDFFFLPEVEVALARAQHKIALVLGKCPSLGDLRFRFGPGATTLTKKRDASHVEKLQAGISCSEGLLPYASKILEEMPALDLARLDYEEWDNIELLPDGSVRTVKCWSGAYSRLSDREVCSRLPVEIHDGVIEFVPKSAKTFRSIAKEPSLNGMVQNAIGDYMSRRLAAFGIDTRDQELNKSLARRGSIDGTLATLDLSSASDTISTELVFALLPVDWFLFLDSAATRHVRLGKDRLRLEKFSSMGNGFTFPLETLIFWAISSSASPDGFASVYGDDIIVSTTSWKPVVRLLEVCGFTVNVGKSYVAGPFRESCGGDFIRGIDIRPFYQKDLVAPKDLFRLHNHYVRRDELEDAERVLSLIHPTLRIYGPDGYGDGHLLGDWLPRSHKNAESRGYSGKLFDTFQDIGLRDERKYRRGDRAFPIYSIYAREGREAVLDRRLPEDPKALAERLGLLRKFQSWYAMDPIPEQSGVLPSDDRKHIKMPSVPGTKGYKRVSIYTLSS